MPLETKLFDMQEMSVGETGTFTGYASVFGIRDLQGDIVERGAFAETIRETDGRVPILDGHDPRVEIGMTSAMVEDARGLRFAGQLYIDSDDPRNDVPDARRAYVRMKRRAEMGKPLGVSIGYRPRAQVPDRQGRRLTAIDLKEISLVTFPANPAAMVLGVKEADAEPTWTDAEVWAMVEGGLALLKMHVAMIEWETVALREVNEAILAERERRQDRV